MLKTFEKREKRSTVISPLQSNNSRGGPVAHFFVIIVPYTLVYLLPLSKETLYFFPFRFFIM